MSSFTPAASIADLERQLKVQTARAALGLAHHVVDIGFRCTECHRETSMPLTLPVEDHISFERLDWCPGCGAHTDRITGFREWKTT
jgi:rRNA maturation endonuclease Nob1